MFTETEIEKLSAPKPRPSARRDRGGGSDGAPLVGMVPEAIVFTERAVAALRAYLVGHGLADYRIFYASDLDLYDLDEYLKPMGQEPLWEPLPPAVAGGAALAGLSHDKTGAWIWESGCLHLRRHEVVVARWYWVDNSNAALESVVVCAAPTAGHYFRLRQELERRRHDRGAAVWQVVTSGYGEPERVPREPVAAGDLVLPPRLLERVEAEVLRFFSDEAAALYKALAVPHRRGMLLYGPPGNGKTSLIRLIGGRLPQVPAMILRPSAKFDTDALGGVIQRWTRQAPAMLIVEDLDWLLKQVNVSTFLNLLDGVESAAGGGLLLIATTNHPEDLDPAINNRPGRFDVVVEVPPPDEALRLQFLRGRLPAAGDEAVRRVATDTEGLAFAHLQEILRLSGLLAINAGRRERTDEDLLRAAETVRQSHEDAVRGFPRQPDVPFGLAALHRGRRA